MVGSVGEPLVLQVPRKMGICETWIRSHWYYCPKKKIHGRKGRGVVFQIERDVVKLEFEATNPPRMLLGCGVSTSYTFFYVICTIRSELKDLLISTLFSEQGSISADFQWTGSTPAGCQEAFRAAWRLSRLSCTNSCDSKIRIWSALARWIGCVGLDLQGSLVTGLFCDNDL